LIQSEFGVVVEFSDLRGAKKSPFSKLPEIENGETYLTQEKKAASVPKKPSMVIKPLGCIG